MRYRRRVSGLLAPEEGLAVPRLVGARGWDPASLGTLVGAKPPVTNPGEDFTLRASLQCYYKFENASDLGEDYKNNIDLTNTNGVTQSATIPSGTYAAPTAIKSADFEAGSSQELTASNANAQEINNITALTVVGWFRPETMPASVMVYSFGGTASAGHRIYKNGADWKASFSNVQTDFSRAVTDGVWYFWSITYGQDTDQIRFFEGTEEGQVAQVGSVAAADKTANTSIAFFLGSWGGSLYWDGLMTEVAFFTERLELSDIQAIQQYGMDGSG